MRRRLDVRDVFAVVALVGLLLLAFVVGCGGGAALDLVDAGAELAPRPFGLCEPFPNRPEDHLDVHVCPGRPCLVCRELGPSDEPVVVLDGCILAVNSRTCASSCDACPFPADDAGGGS